jgi:hypothetical protein
VCRNCRTLNEIAVQKKGSSHTTPAEAKTGN